MTPATDPDKPSNAPAPSAPLPPRVSPAGMTPPAVPGKPQAQGAPAAPAPPAAPAGKMMPPPPVPRVTAQLPKVTGPAMAPAPKLTANLPKVTGPAPMPPKVPGGPPRGAIQAPAAPAVPSQSRDIALSKDKSLSQSLQDMLAQHGASSYSQQMERGRASIVSHGEGSPDHGREDSRRPLSKGTEVGQYTVVSLMGEGGFGLTYLATHKKDGRKVVLKEHMPAGVALRDDDGVFVTTANSEAEEYFISTLDEFRDEISTIMGLEHPNIVRVEDSFEANGTAYYVMPLVQGYPMEIPMIAELDATKKAREARRIKLQLLSLLDALVYLEQNNVVHRDIKPENVLVTPEGQPILLDFGSARQLRPGKEYSNKYTPAFCAPEQCISHHDKKWGHMPMGSWTDMYSLAACFYYRITRMLPPKAETRIFSLPNDPYRPLAKRKDLLETYGEVFLSSLDRALMLNYEDRWQSSSDWRNFLDRGVRADSTWKFKDTFPYLTTVFFAGVSALLFAVSVRKDREHTIVTEANSEFSIKLMSDFFADAADLPGFSPLQGRFSQYLSEYIAVADKYADADDDLHQESAAMAYMNIGVCQEGNGDFPRACMYYRRAENMAENLAQRHPADTRFHYMAAQARLACAQVLYNQSNYTEAEELLHSATATLRGIFAARPQSPDYACMLAHSLLLDVEMNALRGTLPEATAKLKEAQTLLADTKRVYPNHKETSFRTAEALHMQGVLDMSCGNLDEAESLFTEETRLYTHLLEKRPYSISLIKGMAAATFHIGQIHLGRAAASEEAANEELDKAEDVFKRHIGLCAELEKLDPTRTDFIYAECSSLAALQRVLLLKGRNSLAEAYTIKLMRKATMLVDRAPNDINYSCMLASAWRASASVHKLSEHTAYVAEDELAQSRAILEGLEKLAPRNYTFLNTYILVLEESVDSAIQSGDKDSAAKWLQLAMEKAKILKENFPYDKTYERLAKDFEEHLQKLHTDAPDGKGKDTPDDWQGPKSHFFHVRFK